MYVEGVVAHGRLKQPELALECFEQLQSHAHLAPTLLAYTAVIRACATRKLWPVALSLFEDLKADGLSPDTVACNAVLVACERGGQLEEAELLLASMKAAGPPPDAISYNTVISTAARGGNWQQALALLDAMSRGGGGGGGRTGKGKGKGVVAPDVYSYSAAISACERGGEPEAALETFRRMRESGVAPNTIAYNTAIRACATAALWPIALTLLDDMRDDDVPRSLVSFNAALAACERGGEWQEAQYLLQELGTEGLVADEITYNTAIASARRAGGRPAARFALGLVRRMMQRPPHHRRHRVHRRDGGGAAGEWRAALALYGRMERAGCAPMALSSGRPSSRARWRRGRTALRLLADPRESRAPRRRRHLRRSHRPPASITLAAAAETAPCVHPRGSVMLSRSSWARVHVAWRVRRSSPNASKPPPTRPRGGDEDRAREGVAPLEGVADARAAVVCYDHVITSENLLLHVALGAPTIFTRNASPRGTAGQDTVPRAHDTDRTRSTARHSRLGPAGPGAAQPMLNVKRDRRRLLAPLARAPPSHIHAAAIANHMQHLSAVRHVG